MPYEILLQHASIVSCLCVFGISHFGLYYLYSSTNTLKIHFRKPIYPNTNDAKNLTERLYYGITGKEYKIYDNLITSQKKNVIVAQPEDWLLGLIQIYCPDLYITEESKLKEELGIDSLNMYEIACKIEERIHVDITNKLGEIVTVSDLRCLTYSENTLER